MTEQLQPPLDIPALETPKPLLPVANFWTHVFAFAADVAILTVVFVYVARLAYDALYPHRWWCQVVGALVTLAYFIIGSSRLTGGQTLGKKLLGIRVVSLKGSELTIGQSLLRGFLVHLNVLAYLFLPQFVLLLGFVLLAYLLRGISEITLPVFSVPLLLAMTGLSYLSVIYALANAIYCGMGPKKLSFHDMAANTAVVRVGDEDNGREFARDWSDSDRVKQKMALWPALVLIILMVAHITFALSRGYSEFRESSTPLEAARGSLDSEAFELVSMNGPSEEVHRKYLEFLEQEKKRKEASEATTSTQKPMPGSYDSLTTEAKRFLQTGTKFLYVFDCDETMTSESLVSDARYKKIADRLPAISAQLSKQYFKNEEGRPAPYEGIQVEFIERLPLYLYSRTRSVWRDIIPVAGASSSARETKTPEQTSNDRPGQNTPTPTAGTGAGNAERP